MGVRMIPALTKIDLPTARPLDVALAVSDLFGFDPDAVLHTSARSRTGVAGVLDAVCREVPPPSELPDDDGTTLRAKVVDSWFEPLRGVICLVQVISGMMRENDRVSIIDPLANSETTAGDGRRGSGRERRESYSLQDVGLILPQRLRTGSLGRGQMGYVIAGLRDPRQAKSGTVMVLQSDLPRVTEMVLPSLPAGFSSEQSVLFASVHPMDGDGFDELSAAVDRLSLNDTGLEVHRTTGASNNDGGPFLGPGLRVGFQGLLHMEVFRQRLLDEFDIDVIVTPPKVTYAITYLQSKKNTKLPSLETEIIEDLADWPSHGHRFKVSEPIVEVRIMAPVDYAGGVMDLIKRKRGTDMSTKTIDETTWFFTANMPWVSRSPKFFEGQ